MLGQTASGEHKVLRIRHHIYHQFVEVFTLADGHWSEATGPPNTIRTDRQHSAVVNGVAYFLVDPILDLHAADSMASFDLATEQWSLTLLRGPLSSEAVTNRRSPRWHGRLRGVTLDVLDGHLMVIHHNDEELTLDLWFRLDNSGAAADDDDEARWCRRYAIRYYAVFHLFYEDEVEPLCVLDDDRGRVVLWVWRHGRRDAVLWVYDPTCDAAVDVVEIANCVDVAVCTRGTLSLGSSPRGTGAPH
ncbi:hypothetical protein GUJ93_ZPchr0013g37756 [Zizania palustris]|uniref:F-box associated domain-containing protein n=1 Tax=Zizania palustris TaxID=103762 RepID=A0A8J6BYN1_ZIZPA|nr:hypothetical protein GUJ93_ZPchr0013g37756 [Zizania palustris]